MGTGTSVGNLHLAPGVGDGANAHTDNSAAALTLRARHYDEGFTSVDNVKKGEVEKCL
ncbi:MAG: hypothetical protein JXR84_09735 [Anaerolineae bacterium]|nr:hypothetical protein [Anaerolineae bacterium]